MTAAGAGAGGVGSGGAKGGVVVLPGVAAVAASKKKQVSIK